MAIKWRAAPKALTLVEDKTAPVAMLVKQRLAFVPRDAGDAFDDALPFEKLAAARIDDAAIAAAASTGLLQKQQPAPASASATAPTWASASVFSSDGDRGSSGFGIGSFGESSSFASTGGSSSSDSGSSSSFSSGDESKQVPFGCWDDRQLYVGVGDGFPSASTVKLPRDLDLRFASRSDSKEALFEMASKVR